MKAICLLLVLLLAKGLSLAGRDLEWSWWMPMVLIWQDVLVALVFGLADRFLLRRAWMGWTCFGLISAYAALNVPMVRTLSTPLTGPLWRAAEGPLSDSIMHHLDPGNVLSMVIVAAVAVGMPLCLRRYRDRQLPWVAWMVGTLILLGGWVGQARVETAGLHRNAMLALWPVQLPDMDLMGPHHDSDWRVGLDPVGNSGKHPLADFRGLAAGRNVVMIVLESTGAGYLQPWGSEEDPMPNLTRLAEDGLLFDRAYCVYPESIKGYFSVLCSRYPAFGVEAEAYETLRTATLSGELGREGYRTGLFHSGRFMYLGMEEMMRDRDFDVLEDAGDISGNHQSSFGVDEPATVERMLTWVDGLEDGEPFFMTYLPIAGHHPYDSPEGGPFPGETERDRYRNALHYGDQAVGQLLEGFRERGLYTNTVFVLFGDHGEAFGDHEGNYGHTLFLYEENVRVPLMVVAPGLWEGSVRQAATASLLDVAPTVLDLLGMERPADYQGRSLLRDGPEMALFFTDYSLGLLGLRDGSWKYIHEINSGRGKLFDLETDPGETTDLSADHPTRIEYYRERLQTWAAAQRERVLAEIRGDPSLLLTQRHKGSN